MKLTNLGLSDQLVADMRTILEGGIVEFDMKAANKNQKVQGMRDKLEQLRKNRDRADKSASQAREQGRDDAADSHEEQSDRIHSNIQDLKDKIKKELGEEVKEDNTNDKSDDGEGLDKVQPKAVKKKFKNRKDKDIDNDGDTDDSDEFLHKKRKAISKAVAQDESVEEEVCDVCGKETCECEDSDDIEERNTAVKHKGSFKATVGKAKPIPGHPDYKGKQNPKLLKTGKGGKYLKYSNLLLKKQKMSKGADMTAINKEIKKERQHLGITEQHLEDLLIHFLPEQEK